MPTPRPLATLSVSERLNFLITNRVPRHALTRFMGWFAKLENPLIRWLSINVWRAFVDDLRLFEAEKTTFRSLHDCFVRELKPGARPLDPDATLISPCDAVIGEFGDLDGLTALQAKGFPYTLEELLGESGHSRCVPRRSLRDAAFKIKHVPPLSRAMRRGRGHGLVHFWRYLERQSCHAPRH